MKRYKLAIVGSGALGEIIADNIKEKLSKEFQLMGILSGNFENALNLSNKLNCNAYKSLDDLILDSPDYVIEAASPDVVKDIGIKILSNGISLIPLSVGAFSDEEFFNAMEKAAVENNSRVHIPSGAVGGFDVLNAATLMEDVKVSVITQKPPKSLNGAPYLGDRILSEEDDEEIFAGSAKEAIEVFPKNVNVAVATALATIGVNDTEVVIKSMPDLKNNRHEIIMVGDTIKINVLIDAKASENNPKSSTLAAYSVISLLKRLVSPITF